MSKYVNKVIELFTKTKQSEKSKHEFHDWLVDNNQEDLKNEAMLHLWKEPNTISKEETQKAFAAFRAKLTPKRDTRIVLWRYAAAIALLVCVTTAYIFTNKPSEISFAEHYSPIGKTNSITLPDGSIVETNSSSILVYPEDFGQHSRVLYLTGEANFKVIKNKKVPFVVRSKSFAVTALGTEFNVSSYPDDNIYKATLISGSVKVENSERNIEEILDVSEQFSYNKTTAKHSIGRAEIEDVTAWQRGELVFRGATVTEIIKVLERKYNVVFHYNEKKKDADKYNFRFQKDASLDKLLDVMKNVADGFDYKIVGDICYIY